MQIGAGATVGGDPMDYDPNLWGISVIGPGGVIADGEDSGSQDHAQPLP